MEDNYSDYITFYTTTKDGVEVEMAVVDEFDFEHKHYVVAAMVKEDTIDEEGLFIYRAFINEEDFRVEKIANSADYNRIGQAYLELQGTTE